MFQKPRQGVDGGETVMAFLEEKMVRDAASGARS